ncbi:MAG: DUF4328 domain-containing protein, partial [Deltaproteobacteria bacterium]|nr:DUF4328 domain-containing protein [Deltaproteobacteria bacterium]
WLTWVAAGLLNRASLTIGRFRPTIEDLRTQTTMGIVTNVLLVISAVLAVSMIRSISAAQDRLHHGEAAQPPTTF